ncbi:unnamed protein product, partial [Prorocentrum cordatum]
MQLPWLGAREPGQGHRSGDPGRRGFHWQPQDVAVLAPQAKIFLDSAEAELARTPQGEAQGWASEQYKLLQKLLKYLHATGEAEVRAWAQLGWGEARLRGLEARLRARAAATFGVVKFALARGGLRCLDLGLPPTIRADLLRPAFAEVACDAVWAKFVELSQASPSPGLLPRLLAELSGCAEAEAAMPPGGEARMGGARQEWSGARPWALGAALLPLVEREVEASAEALRRERPVRVAVLGGCCLTAALAARLGCEVTLVERGSLNRRLLEAVLEDNDLEVVVADRVPPDVDVLVWEGVDEDTLVEPGHLQLVRGHLQGCVGSGAPLPRLVPERLCINAAPIVPPGLAAALLLGGRRRYRVWRRVLGGRPRCRGGRARRRARGRLARLHAAAGAAARPPRRSAVAPGVPRARADLVRVGRRGRRGRLGGRRRPRLTER